MQFMIIFEMMEMDRKGVKEGIVESKVTAKLNAQSQGK